MAASHWLAVWAPTTAWICSPGCRNWVAELRILARTAIDVSSHMWDYMKKAVHAVPSRSMRGQDQPGQYEQRVPVRTACRRCSPMAASAAGVRARARLMALPAETRAPSASSGDERY